MDFYVILGLEPGASPAEIKRAYRRLSRRYHPGVNPGDRAAEAMFAPDRRGVPDAERSGAAAAITTPPAAVGAASASRRAFEFAGFRFFVRGAGARSGDIQRVVRRSAASAPMPDEGTAGAGADLHAALTVSFEESIRGVDRQVVVTRQVAVPGLCAGAGGSGCRKGVSALPGDRQGAVGARAHGVLEGVRARAAARGASAIVSDARSAARTDARAQRGGAGARSRRVSRTGHGCGSQNEDTPGRRGGRTGDLYVDVHVQPHPLIRARRRRPVSYVPVAVHEAVLGARIERADAGRPRQARCRRVHRRDSGSELSGRGAPTASAVRGDLIVEVKLVLPAVVDERSKELMREFGRLNSEDVETRLAAMTAKRSGKAYYMISAVAQKYNIHPQTLRLYRHPQEVRQRHVFLPPPDFGTGPEDRWRLLAVGRVAPTAPTRRARWTT